MNIEIVESVTFTMTKEEKDSLFRMVSLAKQIQNIDLDSNSALEELDEIKSSKILKEFLDYFSATVEDSKAK